MWYRAAWISPMQEAFNRAFPGRDRASDGTIGDMAHAAGTSGHNPDDTPGVVAERQDADGKPEVRAADVTSVLRDSRGVTMRMVVNRVLATPRDRDRLIYIICDGMIWSAANGWHGVVYTGVDRHYGHAHFSGHPSSDDDDAPWSSILSFVAVTPQQALEIDMEQTEKLVAPWQANSVGNALAVVMETRKALFVDEAATGYGLPAPASALGRLHAELAELRTAVAGIQAGQIPQESLNAAVTAAFQAILPELSEIVFAQAQRAESE